MTPINNSDTAWLIVSDYNQENGKYYEDLKEDVNDPEISQWHYEYRLSAMSVGSQLSRLAGCDMWDIFGIQFDEVGVPMFITGSFGVGGIVDGEFIGGQPD